MASACRLAGLWRQPCRAVLQAARDAVSDSARRTHGAERRRFSGSRGARPDHRGWRESHYLGYAGSSGHPSERGLLQDAAAAYAFTSARYDASRIVVWGFSLGTGVAVAVAAEH